MSLDEAKTSHSTLSLFSPMSGRLPTDQNRSSLHQLDSLKDSTVASDFRRLKSSSEPKICTDFVFLRPKLFGSKAEFVVLSQWLVLNKQRSDQTSSFGWGRQKVSWLSNGPGYILHRSKECLLQRRRGWRSCWSLRFRSQVLFSIIPSLSLLATLELTVDRSFKKIEVFVQHGFEGCFRRRRRRYLDVQRLKQQQQKKQVKE